MKKICQNSFLVENIFAMNKFRNFQIQANSLTMDLAARKFFIEKNQVYLRNKEFDLLFYFIENPGRILTRTELLEDVWDRNICCNSNTVDVHVSKLRRKLKYFTKKQLIKTVYCSGYIFEN